MIIEITGIPGVGKSTIIEKLKKEFSLNKKIVFDIKKYICKFEFLSNSLFFFDLILLCNFFKLKKQDLIIFFESLKKILDSKNSFFNKINILRNCYKKIVIHRILQKNDSLFFVDEGISHLPFNLFVDGDSNFTQNELEVFMSNNVYNDFILIVDSDDSIIKKRLENRGINNHRRLSTLTDKEIEHFLHHSRRIIELIKIKTNRKYIYMNENEINIKEIISNMEKEIVFNFKKIN